jgi:hypothetical protein
MSEINKKSGMAGLIFQLFASIKIQYGINAKIAQI